MKLKKFLITKVSVETNKAKYIAKTKFIDRNDKGKKFLNKFFKERRNNLFINSKDYFAVSFVLVLRKLSEPQRKKAKHETQNLLFNNQINIFASNY